MSLEWPVGLLIMDESSGRAMALLLTTDSDFKIYRRLGRHVIPT
jgi:hypothetical protein